MQNYYQRRLWAISCNHESLSDRGDLSAAQKSCHSDFFIDTSESRHPTYVYINVTVQLESWVSSKCLLKLLYLSNVCWNEVFWLGYHMLNWASWCCQIDVFVRQKAQKSAVHIDCSLWRRKAAHSHIYEAATQIFHLFASKMAKKDDSLIKMRFCFSANGWWQNVLT